MLITQYQKYTGNYTNVYSVPCTQHTALGKSMHVKTGRSVLRLFSVVTSGWTPCTTHWYYTTLSGWEHNQCTNKWSLYTVSHSSLRERALYTLNHKEETDLIFHPLLCPPGQAFKRDILSSLHVSKRLLFEYKIVIVMEVNQQEVHWAYAQKEHVKINNRLSSQKCGHLWAKTVIIRKIE